MNYSSQKYVEAEISELKCVGQTCVKSNYGFAVRPKTTKKLNKTEQIENLLESDNYLLD